MPFPAGANSHPRDDTMRVTAPLACSSSVTATVPLATSIPPADNPMQHAAHAANKLVFMRRLYHIPPPHV